MRSGVETKCIKCNKVFQCYPSDLKLKRAKFCGQECYWNWRSQNIKGENHPSWLGNRISYKGLHIWLKAEFGRANKCENSNCKKQSKSFDWALKKGKRYERRIENFWQLCRKCHKAYDFNEKTRKRNKKGVFIKL